MIKSAELFLKRITKLNKRNNLNYSLSVFQLLLVFVLPAITFSSYGIEKETLERLVDENRELSSALELHLTSVDSAIINSTINLDHEDAWLFFDNVRPSDVIEKYGSSIKISGTTLSVGGNGRVAKYINGAVVMPFGSSFNPLIIYTEEDFEGNTNQLNINTFHKNLGDFDNCIKSFKLKRGYMATFANNADGSGYSRVFIADKEDIEIKIMPAELHSTVSFIRVFNYDWVSKKGWCGWDSNDIELTKSTWRYDWSAGGETTNNVEYTPIRQNAGWPGWDEINNKQNVSHLLGYNEPDHVEQSNITVNEAIAMWPEFMKSGLRIGSPATTDFNWVIEFVKRCDELNYRVDFVAVHAYWGNDPSSYWSSLNWVHQATGRPIWITEWNYGANWTNEWWPNDTWELTPANEDYAYNKIKAIVDFFDDTPWIERYSIYNWVEDRRAIVLGGELTKAGEYYATNKSAVAFNKDYEVIPDWNYSTPELEYRYFAIRNSIRLSWTDLNGELSKDYKIEKKVNNGIFETIHSGYIPGQFFLDPMDPAVTGKVTYRLSLATTTGAVLKSNEVTFYQTFGEGDVQFGNFSVKNLDVNPSQFSMRYSKEPIVLLGIPTFNNNVPITQRITAVSKNSFIFNFSAWSYFSNPQMTEPEKLSNIAVPAGSYNFGGLKAEVKSVSEITRNWVTVNFGEAFEKIPVVFCTLASNKNFFPLTVGVRNVKRTGFEICLKSEEAITAILNAETINYLAIETGSGVIDEKRITVGRNFEENGISQMPLEIRFDSSYTEPALFAGLLSAEDNFASTLRYSLNNNSSFELTKQRELSGEDSEMQTDDYGWMIIDLADGQDFETAVHEISDGSLITFYPNPANETIHFNFDKPTRVEIIDLLGHTLLKSLVMKSLDISALPTGLYIVKIPGRSLNKLIVEK